MHMSCHSIQVNTILPDVAKQVRNKNGFSNGSHENYALELSVG